MGALAGAPTAHERSREQLPFRSGICRCIIILPRVFQPANDHERMVEHCQRCCEDSYQGGDESPS